MTPIYEYFGFAWSFQSVRIHSLSDVGGDEFSSQLGDEDGCALEVFGSLRFVLFFFFLF